VRVFRFWLFCLFRCVFLFLCVLKNHIIHYFTRAYIWRLSSFRSLESAMVTIGKWGGLRDDLFFVFITWLCVRNVHKVGDHRFWAHIKRLLFLLRILRNQALVKCVKLSICCTFNPVVCIFVVTVVVLSATLELNMALDWSGDQFGLMMFVILRALDLNRVEDRWADCELIFIFLVEHCVDSKLCCCMKALKR